MTGRIVLDLDDVTDEEKEWALHRAVNGLREDDPMRSASNPVMGWQRAVLWTLLVVTIGFAIWRPMETAVALIGLCTFGYVFTMLDRVLIFKTGLASAALVISDEEARAGPDAELPHYTILVPAYNEPEVVADLLGAMAALEYPTDKLQVLLLLEADDEVTITAAQSCADSASTSRAPGCRYWFADTGRCAAARSTSTPRRPRSSSPVYCCPGRPSAPA